jgi:transposase
MSTDTSTIYNKYNTDLVKRNKINKNKKVIKISIITDFYGIPLNIQIYSGNVHDSNILEQQLNENLYIDEVIVDKYKKYFLADKGYDSQKLRDILEELDFHPIISYNKRNTKDVNKIKKLSSADKEIYSNRIIVENTFAKLKMHYSRLNTVHERQAKNYMGFLFLAFIDILLKRIYTA